MPQLRPHSPPSTLHLLLALEVNLSENLPVLNHLVLLHVKLEMQNKKPMKSRRMKMAWMVGPRLTLPEADGMIGGGMIGGTLGSAIGVGHRDLSMDMNGMMKKKRRWFGKMKTVNFL